MILTIRTDKPEAELGLYAPDGEKLEYFTWQAHRELSKTILVQIRELLTRHTSTFDVITGVVVFQGPGSFTGLRIGITVANALGYSLQKPVVGASGDNWRHTGIQSLQKGQNDKIVMPEYGAEAHITAPRK